MVNEEKKPDPSPSDRPKRPPIGFTVSNALARVFKALAYVALVCAIIAAVSGVAPPVTIILGLLAFAAFISLSEASTTL